MGSCPDTDIDPNTVYWKMSKVKRCEQYIRKKLYTNSILRSWPIPMFKLDMKKFNTNHPFCPPTL